MEEYYEIQYVDQTYNGIFEVATYESCTFRNCNMESLKMGESKFIDCTFEECDLSNCDIHGTAFRNVRFASCKMIGLRFDTCNHFGLAMEMTSSVLDYCIFTKVDLRKCNLMACSLKDVDFAEANLQKIEMTNCTLTGAIFYDTNLIGADLRESTEIIINPRDNQILKMKISQSELIGLLSNYKLIVV